MITALRTAVRRLAMWLSLATEFAFDATNPPRPALAVGVYGTGLDEPIDRAPTPPLAPIAPTLRVRIEHACEVCGAPAIATKSWLSPTCRTRGCSIEIRLCAFCLLVRVVRVRA